MITNTEPRVTMRHARAASQSGSGVLCAPGVRAWFSRYDLDYHRFIREGLPLSEVRHIHDEFAQRVIAALLQEMSDGR